MSTTVNPANAAKTADSLSNLGSGGAMLQSISLASPNGSLPAVPFMRNPKKAVRLPNGPAQKADPRRSNSALPTNDTGRGPKPKEGGSMRYVQPDNFNPDPGFGLKYKPRGCFGDLDPGFGRLPPGFPGRDIDPGMVPKNPGPFDLDPGFTRIPRGCFGDGVDPAIIAPGRRSKGQTTELKTPPKMVFGPIIPFSNLGKTKPKDSEPELKIAKAGLAAGAVDSPDVFVNPAQMKAAGSVLNAGGGSGVVIANQGNQYTMITNAHVVAFSNRKVGGRLEVTLPNGLTAVGRVVAIGNPASPNGSDLAVIRFESKMRLPVARMAAEPPRAGQKMFAVGFPYEGNHTTGTAKLRVDKESGKTVSEGDVTKNLLDGYQTRGNYGVVSTSTVIQGMSGGGTFDAKTGELIGVSGQDAHPIIPPPVEGKGSYRKTVGRDAQSLSISVDEIKRFLSENKVKLPS